MNTLWTKRTLTSSTPSSIKKGDHAAFATAYNDLHTKVFRFFLKKVITDDKAKDLTQQTFIRLWQFRHTLSEEYPLEKQIFVIAHSLLINHFETENRRKKISSQPPFSGEYACDPAEQESFELSDHIKTAISALPPVRKRILTLKIFHDRSNREIATQMEISVKTVEDHITKAFRRIKEIMTLLLIPFLYYISLH